MIFRLIKQWYENMKPRERVMLVAVSWVLIVIWLLFVVRQIKALKTEVASKTRDLQMQQVVLNDQERINRDLNAEVGRMDHSYNSSQLFELVTRFANSSGLTGGPGNSGGVTQLTPQTTDIFKINGVTVNFKSVPIKNLVKFAADVQEQTPYLAIDEVNLTPNNFNPTLIDGNIRVNSLELLKNALNRAGAATTPARGGL